MCVAVGRCRRPPVVQAFAQLRIGGQPLHFQVELGQQIDLDLRAVVDVGGVQRTLEGVQVVLPGEDVVLAEDPLLRLGPQHLFLGNPAVHQRGQLQQLFILHLFGRIVADLDQPSLSFAQDQASLVDGDLGWQAGIGHAAAGVSDRGDHQIPQQAAGMLIHLWSRRFGFGLRGGLFPLAASFRFLGSGSRLDGGSLGPLVDLDAAGIGQAGAAGGHRADEVAVLPGASPQRVQAGDGDPFAAAIVLRVELRREFALGVVLGIASDELEAGLGRAGPAPFKIGVPLFGRAVLHHRRVVILVAVLAVLGEAA